MKYLQRLSEDMRNIQSIHFVGLKGVGMTPLAIIAKEAGIKVTGSDLGREFITDISLKKAGIIPFVGFSPEHVGDVDLVITTGAHGGFDNVEVKRARQKNIPVLTQGEAVGEFMKGEIFGRKFSGISVTGSHGKTTTTAMIATILSENGYQPSFLIGTGDVTSLGSAGRFGSGEYFVAEADEYMTEPKYDSTAKLLWQHPKIAVITNIDLDHPDVYANIEGVRETFLRFARQLANDGVLVIYGDDLQAKKLLSDYEGKSVTYGFGKENDYILHSIITKKSHTTFQVLHNGKELGEFVLNISGEHNVLNATAAIIVSLQSDLTLTEIKNGLLAFRGSKRRMEYLGKLQSGAQLFDDYAHHPTEIRKTLHAFREKYREKNYLYFSTAHLFTNKKTIR